MELKQERNQNKENRDENIPLGSVNEGGLRLITGVDESG